MKRGRVQSKLDDFVGKKPASEQPQLADFATKNFPFRSIWEDVGSGLMHFQYKPIDDQSPQVPFDKIAAFDLDGTLITTKSGRVFAKNDHDWTFLGTSIPKILRDLYSNGYRLVIFTNQAGLTTHEKRQGFKSKIENIASQVTFPASPQSDLKIAAPLDAFMAIGYDSYRKPNIGMFDYLTRYHQKEVSVENSFYVGDAAGRPDGWRHGRKKDHSIADIGFALNLEMPFYTPEEYFMKEEPYVVKLAFDPRKLPTEVPLFLPSNTPLIPDGGGLDVVIMIGYPGSGKTTFVSEHLLPRGYVHVNTDTLRSREKCLKVARAALQDGKRIVVDNTNPDTASRAYYITLAKEHGASVRCFVMNVSEDLAKHCNYFRQLTGGKEKISSVVYNTYKSRFQEPKLSEGFAEIKTINLIPKFAIPQHAKIFKRFLL